ncbi:MAG: hypothetical protein AAFX53_08600 [Bacteroidota bacterium]
MRKLFLLGIFPMLFFSCGQKEDSEGKVEVARVELSPSTWPKKTVISAKAMDTLKAWTEFNDMETSFDALYGVENLEDLRLVIENMVEKQNLWAKSEYPGTFALAQVKSRQKVFKTYMLKTKNDLEFQTDPQETLLKMIHAYNAVRAQFNVTVNNTLDANLILEDGTDALEALEEFREDTPKVLKKETGNASKSKKAVK